MDGRSVRMSAGVRVTCVHGRVGPYLGLAGFAGVLLSLRGNFLHYLALRGSCAY